MKNLKILKLAQMVTALSMLTIISVFVVSCEDEDKDKFDVFELGGFVRFQTPFPTVANISSLAEAPNITISNVLEAPDGNVSSYSIEVSAVVGGQEYGPVPFGETVTSFPTPINITMSDLSTALGFDIGEVGFADIFAFTGTAVNDQGVVYAGNDRQTFTTADGVKGGNNSSDLLDELGYRNAFEFAFAIPCPPNNNPIAGDWTIEMIDLYGDGWDGAFLTVEIDGATTDYTIAASDAATHVFTVPAGTAVLRISYTTGAYEEEHVYSIINPNGNTYGPFGPEPGTCPDYTSP